MNDWITSLWLPWYLFDPQDVARLRQLESKEYKDSTSFDELSDQTLHNLRGITNCIRNAGPSQAIPILFRMFHGRVNLDGLDPFTFHFPKQTPDLSQYGYDVIPPFVFHTKYVKRFMHHPNNWPFFQEVGIDTVPQWLLYIKDRNRSQQHPDLKHLLDIACLDVVHYFTDPPADPHRYGWPAGFRTLLQSKQAEYTQLVSGLSFVNRLTIFLRNYPHLPVLPLTSTQYLTIPDSNPFKEPYHWLVVEDLSVIDQQATCAHLIIRSWNAFSHRWTFSQPGVVDILNLSYQSVANHPSGKPIEGWRSNLTIKMERAQLAVKANHNAF